VHGAVHNKIENPLSELWAQGMATKEKPSVIARKGRMGRRTQHVFPCSCTKCMIRQVCKVWDRDASCEADEILKKETRTCRAPKAEQGWGLVVELSLNVLTLTQLHPAHAAPQFL
jgi:hypothetical protein